MRAVFELFSVFSKSSHRHCDDIREVCEIRTSRLFLFYLLKRRRKIFQAGLN